MMSGYRAHFAAIDPAVVEAKLVEAGFDTAEGSLGSLADRPVKMVRAVR